MRRAAFLDRLPSTPCRMLQRFVPREVDLNNHVGAVRKNALLTEEYQATAGYVDQDQLTVITQALTQSGIILARGPYGCGKTTLIIHLLRAYRAAHPQKRILVASETNAAPEENMSRAIRKGFVRREDVVRLGMPRMNNGEPFVPDPDLRGCYLYFILEDCRKELRGRKLKGQEIETKVERLKKDILATRPIIVVTLAQMGKKEYANLRYHLVINDEGAQTVESSLVLAAREDVETVVVMGDPNQLLPYSPLKPEEKIRFDSKSRRHKLDWSIVHHMFHAHCQRTGGAPFPGVTMTAEFRSHPRITGFLQPFYNFDLRDRARTSEPYLEKMKLPTVRLQREWFAAAHGKRGRVDEALVNRRRVIWLSPTDSVSPAQAKADEERKPYSKRDPEEANLLNAVEATAVVELMLRIRAVLRVRRERDPDEAIKDVLIITPYPSQVRKIRRELREHRDWLEEYIDYDIATIDSSQGREAAITIVSLVRNKDLGFMKNYPARSLVALSRSRDYLFVLGCHLAYVADPAWMKLLHRANTLGVPCMELEWSTGKAEARAERLERLQYDRKMAGEEAGYVDGGTRRRRT